MEQCNNYVYSESVFDYIVEALPGLYEDILKQPQVCVEKADEHWLIAHSVLPTNIKFNVTSLVYYTIPRLYGLMDISSMQESGISTIQNQQFLDVKGEGVLIGFIDTGIDYLRREFQDINGNSRIEAIWDQTIDDTDKQSKYNYGQIYRTAKINEALKASREGGNPYDYVPTLDENGHGTFMAGIAAGGIIKGDNGANIFSGAAPETRIAMVKLKKAKEYLKEFFLVGGADEVYQESDIMLGVTFLREIAEELQVPLVICIGLGSGLGAHAGRTPLADMLDTVSKRKNTVVVVPVGNEAAQRNHFAGYSAGEESFETVEINVEKAGEGFVMEIWAKTLDTLSVSIVSPLGEIIPRIPVRFGVSNVFKLLLENTVVSVDYQIAETLSGYEVAFFRFVAPAKGGWKVNVYSLTNLKGEFDAWLPIGDFNNCEVTFVKAEPNTTLTTPSGANRVISVGAYNHITGAVAYWSGRGYTSGGIVKPEIVAPGVEVYGPATGHGYVRKSGTSIAAAHVAGAAAIILCWGVTRKNYLLMGSSEVKALLVRGAKRDNYNVYPNVSEGYGKLDLYEAFIQIRNS